MDIKDIKGPLSLGGNWPLILLILIVLIFFVMAVYWFLRRFVKTMEPCGDGLTPLSPYEAARRALDSLRHKGFGPPGRVGEYYFQLSGIVRRYLEGRFNIPVVEMTTEEFLAHLRGSKTLPLEQREVLGEFLSHCDMVKFAKYGPCVNEIEKSFSLAEKVIEETRPQEEKDAVS